MVLGKFLQIKPFALQKGFCKFVQAWKIIRL